MVLGSRDGLEWFRNSKHENTKVKFQGRLGRGGEGAVRILNGIVTVTKTCLRYEANQRLAEILIDGMGVGETSKGVTTPGMGTTEEEATTEHRKTWRVLFGRFRRRAIDCVRTVSSLVSRTRTYPGPCPSQRSENIWKAVQRVARS
jgi:hypothetical protein